MSKKKSFKLFVYLIFGVVFGLPFSVDAANVAKIGDVEYATIGEAITAASDGDTIILLTDVSAVTIDSGKKIIIDLNNFQISDVTNNGNLHLKSGNIGFGYNVRDIENTASGVMVVEDVVVKAIGKSGAPVAFKNYGTITFDNVVLDYDNGETKYTDFLYNYEGAKAVIEDGTYSAYVLFRNEGELIINGGIFITNTNNVSNQNFNLMTINSGTFECNSDFYCISNEKGHLVINNAIFNGVNGVQNTGEISSDNDTKSVIDIYYAEFNVDEQAFWNNVGSAGGIINFYDGKVNHSGNGSEDVVFGSYGFSDDFPNIINIYGGTIKSLTGNVLLSGSNILNIGKNDGNVLKNSPHIDIRSGNINDSTSAIVNFYDGTLVVEDTITDNYGTINVPTGYYVKYDGNADGSNTAYLELVGNNSSNFPDDDVQEEEKENPENPKTGISTNVIYISLSIVVASIILFILNKKKKFI